MKQRVGDKNRHYVEQRTGRKIRSMWHRGGRNPRYWDVFFEGGDVGLWFPEQRQKLIGGQKVDYPERLEMTGTKWRNP